MQPHENLRSDVFPFQAEKNARLGELLFSVYEHVLEAYQDESSCQPQSEVFAVSDSVFADAAHSSYVPRVQSDTGLS
jgi:hypothetical protein